MSFWKKTTAILALLVVLTWSFIALLILRPSTTGSASDASLPLIPSTAVTTAQDSAVPLDSLQLDTAPSPPDSGASHAAADIPVTAPRPADARRASFSLQVRDVVTPYRIFSVAVLPNETIELEALFTQPGTPLLASAEAGLIAEGDDGQWSWTAPSTPGHYTLTVAAPTDEILINAFVKVPFNNGQQNALQGYRIGAYEAKPLRNDPRFLPPKGLIRVDDSNRDIRVSPHFTLGEFTCHQPGDPKFILLDERLILKLEMLLEELQKRGIPAQTFTLMSTYRTPAYNKQIGNTTTYSLHLFGRAADIFVDDDNDGRMDDLNGDGAVTKADAKLLFDLFDSLKTESWYQPFLGGLGLYGPKPHRGPFVHVDVRGYTARW